MANGLFGGGDGSIESPLLIEDSWDLNNIRNNVLLSYKLIKDIDMNVIQATLNNRGWVSIPSFKGILDGNGFVIKNLFIANHIPNAVVDLTFITELRGGTVRNLGFVNPYIRYNTTATGYGTIIGKTTTISCLIENCYVQGGEIGSTAGIIMSGLVGLLDYGTMANCYIDKTNVYTNSNSTTAIGGLVYKLTNGSKMLNCYSNITPSYNNGALFGNALGYLSTASTIVNCFYDNSKSITGIGTAVTAAQMTQVSTFTNWTGVYYNNLNKLWTLIEGQLPRFAFQTSEKYLIFVNNEYKTLVNKVWTAVSATFPTEDMFITYGLNRVELGSISALSINELMQYKYFDIVCAADNFKVVKNQIKLPMGFDSQVGDGVILRKTIDFSTLGDSIYKMQLVY